MRLMSGVLAGQDFTSTLTGDDSLTKRPMRRIIEPLELMGARIRSQRGGYAPLVIEGGKLRAVRYKTGVASAQVKSCVIFAGLYADGVTEIEEPVKSRDHTERMLSLFGAKLVIEGLRVSVHGGPVLKGRDFEIPGDISGAAFFIVGASILKGSSLRITDVLFNRTRMGAVDALRDMGSEIEIENKRFNGYEELCDIVVNSSALKGITIEKERIPSLIDELPILFVAAVFAEGDTHIKGASELRVKETDRIASMSSSLGKMGAKISVDGDDVRITGTGALRGARTESAGDHRTAMALAVASLAAEGPSEITDTGCVNTSFPGFFETLGTVSVRK
jgi:3-phosphoshikimate 1-carboxyvinyltransferase